MRALRISQLVGYSHSLIIGLLLIFSFAPTTPAWLPQIRRLFPQQRKSLLITLADKMCHFRT